MAFKIKKKDLIILNLLLENSRCKLSMISKKSLIPLTTIFDRLNLLVNKKYITRFVSKINPSFLRHSLRCMFIVDENSKFLQKELPYEINSVFKLKNNLYLIEAFFKDITQFNCFRKKIGCKNIKKKIIISKIIKDDGFVFDFNSEFSYL